MIDDVAGSGHEDVVAVHEEGLELLMFVLRIAEVAEIDGRRLWRRGRKFCATSGRVVWRAVSIGLGIGDGDRLGGEDVAARAGVFDILALGQLIEVQRRIDAGV